MARNFLLLVIFVILGVGFWAMPDSREIAAGVAIFLLGMMSMQDGFKTFTGGVLERFLGKATDTIPKSLFFGATITTLMQSSSLVSVISISFISAGLITLTQGIGIIFGANLGTTTGAWLVAGFGLKVDIAAYAMPMLVFGVILMFQKNSKKLSGIGSILGGIGFLFLGIAFMKEGFEGFRSEADLSQFALEGLPGLLIYTGIGILATVVMQSSHATLLLTIAALASGQVSYENALALAIGSNVGTTVTAILGSLGATPPGQQLAGAHLIFNLITGLVAILGIHQFAAGVEWISQYLGIAKNDYTLKLAVFHTLFNLTGVIIMLPLINRLSDWLKRTIPEEEVISKTVKPRFLNDSALNLPDTALKVVQQEVGHLAQNTFEILAHGLNLHRTDILSKASMSEIVARSNFDMSIRIRNLYRHKVKPLFNAILQFSARAESQMLPEQVQALSQLRYACKRLVDCIKLMKELQRNMTEYAQSDNQYMQHEYNRIRRILGKLLRALFSISEVEELENVILQLEELQLEAERNDVVANGNLDKLIREQLIEPDMASSLMNDSDYANSLARALLDSAKAVYGGTQTLASQASLIEPRMEIARAETEEYTEEQLQSQKEQIDSLKSPIEPL